MSQPNLQPHTPELRLLFACGRLLARGPDEARIRSTLEGGIDWNCLAHAAIHHGMGGMVGNNLLRVAPEEVPAEIAEALRTHIERKRRSNAASLVELVRILKALSESGIEAIVLKGPALALRVYGDLGLRDFRDLDFLVRDQDMTRTMTILLHLGYQRQMTVTPAQIEMIQYLQGQEFVYSESAGMGAEPHIRLTSSKMALDIDYDALFRRARQSALNGVPIRLLAPEDDLIALAIHGGKELWWNIKWACDIALFIDVHPSLDWPVLLERAKQQGCLRMVLLAVSLAETFFDAALPEAVRKTTHSDRRIAPLMAQILAGWESGQVAGPPSGTRVSLEVLSLHDGFGRRARHIARTLLLPGPQHVAAIPLPRSWRFAYVPIKLVHDTIALPLWIAGRRVWGGMHALRRRLVAAHIVLALLLSSSERRSKYVRHEKMRRRAASVLAEHPQDAKTWCRLGDALAGLGRYRPALQCYEKALEVTPDSLNAWYRRSAALAALGRNADAEEPAANPTEAKGWAVRAGFCLAKRRFHEAAAASDCALELEPQHAAALRIGITARLWACDWQRRDSDLQHIAAGCRTGRDLAGPIEFLRLSPSERDNFLAAQVWSRSFPVSKQPLWCGQRYEHDKLRIAYMSSDFRDHVVADAIIGCLEQHDRSQFKTTAISLANSDGSEMRRRLESCFDRFISVSQLDDLAIARKIRELEIDILIDLNGYAGAHRTGILAHRPAPVQVHYLGFPGTMAAPFMDYLIADRLVIPEQNRCYYTEHVVRLPYTYMPNDDRRKIADRTWSRTEAGLPEKGFVFACHNDERKLGPEVFSIWMRLLERIDDSVLWLKSMNASAVLNLRREATLRGIAPERLIFAPRLTRSEDHLARLRLADLFLDTLPYNAHATACDALWSGLPLITCRGEAFAGLVASSILHACGLPELVTSSLSEYEALALTLADNPARLSALRAKVARARQSAPLFDTASHARHLEHAYLRMWERQRAGLPPDDFEVAASPSRIAAAI